MCGFEEQSADTRTYDQAFDVMNEHQEEDDCSELCTIWEAVHASSLH